MRIYVSIYTSNLYLYIYTLNTILVLLLFIRKWLIIVEPRLISTCNLPYCNYMHEPPQSDFALTCDKGISENKKVTKILPPEISEVQGC